MYQQVCTTVEDGYYDTICTTTSSSSSTTTTSTGGGNQVQSGASQGSPPDGCQYKWEGKGEYQKETIANCNNMKCFRRKHEVGGNPWYMYQHQCKIW